MGKLPSKQAFLSRLARLSIWCRETLPVPGWGTIMNTKSGRIFLACCVATVLGGLVAYGVLVTRSGGRAAAQALSDVGKFKVGSTVGMERAGFSGRVMVQVFTTADDPNWPAISACLQSAEVEAEMGAFVGVLVDARAEPEVESAFRRKHGLQLIVRGLNGAFLGGLKTGFKCPDLVGLLKSIRVGLNREIEKSPIYTSLMLSPDAIDYFKTRSQTAKAARFVELLKEFEGESSPAVQAAEARLNQ